MLQRDGTTQLVGPLLRSLVLNSHSTMIQNRSSLLPVLLQSLGKYQCVGLRRYCNRSFVSRPNYQALFDNYINQSAVVKSPSSARLMQQFYEVLRSGSHSQLPLNFRQQFLLQQRLHTIWPQYQQYVLINSSMYLNKIQLPNVRNLRMGIPNLPVRWPNVQYPEWMRIKGIWARVAIVNGLNTVGHNLPYMLAALVAQLVSDNRLAYCRAAAAGPLPFDGRWYGVIEKNKEEQTKKSRLKWLQALLLMAANAIRIMRLMWLFGGLILAAPFALYLGWGREKWLRKCREQLGIAGPAFIKWGQWVATRQDMFPPDMCEEFSKLHTKAPEHEFEFTKRAFEQSFSVPLDWVFTSFDEEPVASGSIGQIHVGTLSVNGAELSGYKPGTKVAVKVRHPGVGFAIERDFAVMMAAAGLAAHLPWLKHLRLEESLTQFSAPLREQVDLALEARHLWRFNYNFRKHSNVAFPMPIFPWISESILVETFEEGEHVNAFISRDNPEIHKQRLAQLGSDTMLQMLLQHNFLHSDLHPGNIKVRMEPPENLFLKPFFKMLSYFSPLQELGENWLYPKLVLLDVGMSTSLSDYDRENLYELFRAFSELDGYNVGKYTLQFAGENQSCPDPEKFQVALDQAFGHLKEIQSWNESESSYGSSAECLNSMLNLARQHRVNIPGHICAVVVTTLVLEGWSGELDPDHSVLQDVKRVVAMREGGSYFQRWLESMDNILIDDERLSDGGLDISCV